jgi:hypothetical protein
MQDSVTKTVALLAQSWVIVPLLLLISLAALYWSAALLQSALARLTRGAAPDLLYFRLMRPGVLVHEVAHALFALLLGGRVTEFAIFERHRSPDGSVRLGHVGYTFNAARPLMNSVRTALVGLAPLPVGCGLIYGLAEACRALSGLRVRPQIDTSFTFIASLAWTDWRLWALIAGMLWVGNTMFPSQEDRKSWVGAAILSVTVGGAVVYATLRLYPQSVEVYTLVMQIAGRAATLIIESLVVPVCLNVVMSGMLYALSLIRRVRGTAVRVLYVGVQQDR